MSHQTWYKLSILPLIEVIQVFWMLNVESWKLKVCFMALEVLIGFCAFPMISHAKWQSCWKDKGIKEGKFLKRLRCCISWGYNKIFWFFNWANKCSAATVRSSKALELFIYKIHPVSIAFLFHSSLDQSSSGLPLIV